jgi:hypothetical protein
MRFLRNIWVQVLLWVILPVAGALSFYMVIGPGKGWTRAHVKGLGPMKPLAEWEIFSLPGALCAFALMYTVLLIWRNKLTGASIAWVLLAAILGPGLEILQDLKTVPGEFDLLDAVFMTAGSLLALAINQLINYRKARV